MVIPARAGVDKTHYALKKIFNKQGREFWNETRDTTVDVSAGDYLLTIRDDKIFQEGSTFIIENTNWTKVESIKFNTEDHTKIQALSFVAYYNKSYAALNVTMDQCLYVKDPNSQDLQYILKHASDLTKDD